MPKDGQATRDRLIAAAEALIIEQGDAATSVDQVIAAAGSSKGAFFHHFSSRADLTAAVVERYVEADLRELERGLSAAGALEDPQARAIAFVRHFEAAGDTLMSEQSGCVYMAVLAERGDTRQGLGVAVTRAIVAWRSAFSDLLTNALPTWTRDECDAFSDHLFVTFEGAFAICRATGDPGHMRRQLGVVRRALESHVATAR